MSAADRGTASDYSKGAALRPAHFLALRRLLAAGAIAGAVLLAVAELSPLYTVVVGSLESPRRSVSAGSNHGYALAIVALTAAAMAAAALRSGRGAAAALTACGVVALLIALAIDLPDTRGSSTLPESVAYADARAKPGRALALEIAGAAALLACGAALLVFASTPRAREPEG